jgi:hypothetical protein
MNLRQLAIPTIGLFLVSCSTPVTNHLPPPTSIDRKNAVIIIKKPPYIQHGTFVEYVNVHSSQGITDWFFHCYPQFLYNLDSTTISDKTRVVITITKVTLTISLPITMRVGQLADKKTLEHEKGHVDIVMQIYEKAQAAALEASEPAIGLRFEGEGANAEEALADALDKAARQVCQNYRKKTVDEANELSSQFDEITKHGLAKISVPEAIKQSYETYKKKHARASTPDL